MSVRTDAPVRVTMLLENNPYPRDVRVRAEAESLVNAGYAVEVIAPRAHGQRRREVVNGVVVRRFWCIDGSGRGALGFLAEYLVAAVALHLAALRALLGGSDVLHLHNPPDVLFAAGAMFRLAGRRVIFDHHDLAPETVEVKFGPGRFVSLARICERLTYAVADHVLATNESYAEIARSRGGRSPAQVTIVRNAPPAAWLAAPLGIREGVLDALRIAYVGSVSAQDGLDGLVPILAGLTRLSPPVTPCLTVVGDGDARPAFEAALRRDSLVGLVTFAGWVGVEEVPALLAAADVCVDPAPATVVNERSTMIKLSEYLALGKPVVAYDLLETRRTVEGAALLVAPGNVDGFVRALAELARDPALRSSLAHAARERAASLTWERSEQALLGAYAAARARSG